MNKTQELHKNQKGFSLAELIIVIAIMAVLVGVLAPAFLRYVEKSRKSADVSAFDSILSAMEACAIDPSIDMKKGDKIILTFTTGTGEFSATCADTGTGDKVKAEMEAICGKQVKLKSTTWSAGNITLAGEVGENGGIAFTMEDNKSGELITGTATGDEGVLTYAPGLADKINTTP